MVNWYCHQRLMLLALVLIPSACGFKSVTLKHKGPTSLLRASLSPGTSPAKEAHYVVASGSSEWDGEVCEDVVAAQRRVSSLLQFSSLMEYDKWYPGWLSKMALILNVAFLILLADECDIPLVADTVESAKSGILVGLPAMFAGGVLERARRARGHARAAEAVAAFELEFYGQASSLSSPGVDASLKEAASPSQIFFDSAATRTSSYDLIALAGAMPLALFAYYFLGDEGFGESVAEDLDEERATVTGLALLGAGTLASSAWLHGFAQASCQAALGLLASRAAIALLPMDLTYTPGADALGQPEAWTSATAPEVAAVWPAIAAAPLAAVPLAALLTAALGAAADAWIERELRPLQRATRAAQDEALAQAAQRGGAYFAIAEGASSARAERRGVALRALVDARAGLLEDEQKRNAAAAVARSALGALAFAASNGAPLAPVMAYLGAELASLPLPLPLDSWTRIGRLPSAGPTESPP